MIQIKSVFATTTNIAKIQKYLDFKFAFTCFSGKHTSKLMKIK